MAAPVELLKKIPLFHELEGRELQTLAQSFKERIFQAGAQRGDRGVGRVGFFVIGEGRPP